MRLLYVTLLIMLLMVTCNSANKRSRYLKVAKTESESPLIALESTATTTTLSCTRITDSTMTKILKVALDGVASSDYCAAEKQLKNCKTQLTESSSPATTNSYIQFIDKQLSILDSFESLTFTRC